MTECVNITSCRPGDPVELIAGTCGAAIPGNEVIVAGEDGRELPRGETGEIFVRGIGVMQGYLDDPAATAEAIDAEGWLHTGDVGTMDENGYVRITGRKKDMFISGGFNVYPAEVEKLLAAHPAILMAAVIGVPDERMGEVGKAFIVLRPGAKSDAAELLAWARDNMANYKVAPHRIRRRPATQCRREGVEDRSGEGIAAAPSAGQPRAALEHRRPVVAEEGFSPSHNFLFYFSTSLTTKSTPKDTPTWGPFMAGRHRGATDQFKSFFPTSSVYSERQALDRRGITSRFPALLGR